jgi:hypothetical protein
MAWYPDTAEEWSAVGGVLAALGVAWKKYRSERRSVMAIETCPAHLQMDDRMTKSEADRAQIKTTLTEHGQSIAVTVALLKELKEDVAENRRLVSIKLDDVSDKISDLAIKIARNNGRA